MFPFLVSRRLTCRVITAPQIKFPGPRVPRFMPPRPSSRRLLIMFAWGIDVGFSEACIRLVPPVWSGCFTRFVILRPVSSAMEGI